MGSYKENSIKATYSKINEIIKELEQKRDREIKIINTKYEPELIKYKNVISTIDELFQQKVCGNCNGKGYISYIDAAGDSDHDDCTVCKGFGFINL